MCACVCARSLQSCLTLYNLRDCSPPGSLSMGFSRQEYWSGLHSLLEGVYGGGHYSSSQLPENMISCRIH